MAQSVLFVNPTVVASSNLAAIINDQTFSINDAYTNGQTVGTVAEANTPSPAATYSITAGNTGSAFAINSSTRVITVNDATQLNNAVTPSYSLTISATNAAGTDTCTATVNVADHTAEVTMTTMVLKSTDGANIPANTVFEFMLPASPTSGLVSGKRVKILDASSNVLMVQEDNRRTDPNGKIRLTKVTGVLATAPGATSTTLTIKHESGTPAAGTPITVANLLAETANNGFDVLVTLTFPDGTVGTASAREAVNASSTWSLTASDYKGEWRLGGACSEFVCSAPVKISGTAHAFLRVEFHIACLKAASGAWNVSTNPITGARCDVCIDNGYKTIASPGNFVYDLKIEVGNSAKTQAKLAGTTNDALLTGAAGDVTLTLSAVSGDNITVTRASGNWAAISAVPNSNDVGKALVEVGGTGRGYLMSRNSGTPTIMSIMVPSATAFANVSRTSGQWKTMGVYHSSQSRLPPQRVWWGTEQKVNAILPTAYLRASEMMLQERADDTSLALDVSVIDNAGGHPFSLQNGISGFGLSEGSTGPAEHIGVASAGQTNAFIHWGNTTDHANARKIMLGQARAGSVKPYWFHDDEYGGLMGIDDSAVYVASEVTNDRAADLVDYPAGSRWYGFALNHSGQSNYLPYILTGDLADLQCLCQHAIWNNLTTNSLLTSTSVSISGSTITSVAHPHETGESIRLDYDGNPGIGGVWPYGRSGRWFVRKLTANTMELYDTYAQAIDTGSTTGRVTFSSSGVDITFSNGYGKSPVLAGGDRQLAWCVRSLAQLYAVFPDIVGARIIGRTWTQANVARKYDAEIGFVKAISVDDANYVAQGPRWFLENNFLFPPWQADYARHAFLNAVEAIYGSQDTASNTAQVLDWTLASAIQVAIRTDASPLWMIGGYYLRNKINGGAIQYTWSGLAQEMIKNNGGVPGTGAETIGHWRPSGVTADIASVANQAAVTVVLKKAGVEYTFFDMTSSTTRDRHIGSWITVGTGHGQIVSISSKGTCVVDCTVTTWDGFASAVANMIVGTGQTCVLPFPSFGNAAAVTGAERDWPLVDTTYVIMELSAVEIAKQRGIDTASYSAAIAHFTGRGVPACGVGAVPTPTEAATIGVKMNVVSRI